MRLQQYLARAGVTSRRKAEELIKAGRVSINDHTAELGAVVEEGDTVRLDGEKVRLPHKIIVIALNKPKGYTTTHEDSHADRLVYELVPPSPGLHSVGRLDKDTEGLLLLTNDGQLTQMLTHPSKGVRKLYRVWSKRGRLNPGECKQLTEGVMLGDGLAQALEAIPSKEGALLTMAEGRKREVRRMLGKLKHPVEKLVRLAVGPIELGSLELGQWRYLEASEIEMLRQNVQPPKLRKPKPPVEKSEKVGSRPPKSPSRKAPKAPSKANQLSETTQARIARTLQKLNAPEGPTPAPKPRTQRPANKPAPLTPRRSSGPRKPPRKPK